MAELVQFPEEIIELQREILNHHPLLSQKLKDKAATGTSDFGDQLAYVCHHCEIMVDGMFDEGGLTYIAKKCLEKLQEMRTIDVLVVEEKTKLH